MTNLSLRTGLALAVAFLGATSAVADTIYLTAGDAIENVKVSAETYKQIEYKLDSKKKTVDADKVLRIEFSGKSPLVDQADIAATEGQIFNAIANLEEYVEKFVTSGRRPTFAWEPAYAMFRLVELNREVGDAANLIAAADRLIAKQPESGYVPRAFLAKAETQFLTNKKDAAKKTLDEFQALIQSQALSGRWRIEEKLASALFDGTLSGKNLRTKLTAISNEAGEQYPIVGTRADVAIAESFIKDEKFGEAEPIFSDVAKSPASDLGTLAAAYTGLGDCIIKRAAASSGDAKAKLLRDAQLAYLRVVVVYKGQSRYVPKAMFWAGRSFDMSTEQEDKDRAQRLYHQVRREFQGTEWATEAGNFIKR